MIGRRVRCTKCNHRFPAGAPEPAPVPHAVFPGAGARAVAPPRPVAQPRPEVAATLATTPPTRMKPVAPEPVKKGAIFIVLLLLGTLAGGVYFGIHWYSKPAPAPEQESKGELFAGIEIGSKGVKLAVIERFKDPELDFDFRILKEDTANTTVIKGLKDTKKFDPDALRDTAKAVKEFHKLAVEEHSVPAGRVFVVASSGVFAPLKDNAKAIDENKQLLASAIKEAIAMPLDFLDADQEVDLSILGTVPQKYLDTAVLIDIGSGNSKGGYRESGGRVAAWNIPYGTKSFHEEVTKRGGGKFDLKALDDARDQVIAPALRKQVEMRPGMENRERIYLSGGASWVTANLTHPRDRKTFRELRTDDITTLNRRLRDDLSRVPPAPSLAEITDEKLRKEIDTEINRAKDTFKPDELLAGLELLQSCSKEFKLDRGDRKIYFANNGKIGWLLGYLMDKGGR
jgi:hypothetical protein